LGDIDASVIEIAFKATFIGVIGSACNPVHKLIARHAHTAELSVKRNKK
jgi:hypothetical protein